MIEVAKKISFKHVVGVIILIAFLSGHVLLVFVGLPEQNKEAFIHSLGMLDAAVIAIVSYYYGSSSGSKAKSDTLEEIAKTKPN